MSKKILFALLGASFIGLSACASESTTSVSMLKSAQNLPIIGGVITSQFNPARVHPITGRVRPHKGVDFGVPVGTAVHAPTDGTVVSVAYQARGAGRYITIEHANGYKTVYMHLSKALVKAGDSVKKGQKIALSGNTGGSTGPHLHYEVHRYNTAVNPMTAMLPAPGRIQANDTLGDVTVQHHNGRQTLTLDPNLASN